MIEVTAGAANKITADIVARADNTPITSGTITFFILALSGTYADMWWNGSGWSSSEAADSGTPSHVGDGHWTLSVAAGCWYAGVRYSFYWKESGDLHIPVSVDIICKTTTVEAGAGAITFTYTLTSTVDSAPIADADVWVSSDLAGTNVIASGRTDQNGEVVFYLDGGTVYVWRQKTGWTFTNPDTEVVA